MATKPGNLCQLSYDEARKIEIEIIKCCVVNEWGKKNHVNVPPPMRSKW